MGGAQIIEDLHQLKQDDQDADIEDMLRMLQDADISNASEGPKVVI